MSAERPKLFPKQLSGLCLAKIDVVVLSRMLGVSDREAATELIGLGFPGREIRERLSVHRGRFWRSEGKRLPKPTRSLAAREVFVEYFGETS
ncbi:MAG: hypothetical protein HYU48_01055 [Candidatus Levybacteria bacterium]|nr:hypothetical protein [Candidatus Levybacteria bacterium]